MEVAVALVAVLLFFVAAVVAAVRVGMGGITRAVIGLVAALVVLLGIQVTGSEIAGVASLVLVIASVNLVWALGLSAWLR